MEIGIDLAKQILGIQKTMIDNTFRAQALFQEQGERVARVVLAPPGGWPTTSEQVWREWLEALQSGRESVQAVVDAQFDMLDGLLTPLGNEG